jgi:hypothetical protein
LTGASEILDQLNSGHAEEEPDAGLAIALHPALGLEEVDQLSQYGVSGIPASGVATVIDAVKRREIPPISVDSP